MCGNLKLLKTLLIMLLLSRTITCQLLNEKSVLSKKISSMFQVQQVLERIRKGLNMTSVPGTHPVSQSSRVETKTPHIFGNVREQEDLPVIFSHSTDSQRENMISFNLDSRVRAHLQNVEAALLFVLLRSLNTTRGERKAACDEHDKLSHQDLSLTDRRQTKDGFQVLKPGNNSVLTKTVGESAMIPANVTVGTGYNNQSINKSKHNSQRKDKSKHNSQRIDKPKHNSQRKDKPKHENECINKSIHDSQCIDKSKNVTQRIDKSKERRKDRRMRGLKSYRVKVVLKVVDQDLSTTRRLAQEEITVRRETTLVISVPREVLLSAAYSIKHTLVLQMTCRRCHGYVEIEGVYKTQRSKNKRCRRRLNPNRPYLLIRTRDKVGSLEQEDTARPVNVEGG